MNNEVDGFGFVLFLNLVFKACVFFVATNSTAESQLVDLFLASHGYVIPPSPVRCAPQWSAFTFANKG